MASPVKAMQNGAGKWEVRINDERAQLLGTFEDTTSRDLFVEAVKALVLNGESIPAAQTTRQQLAA